MSKNSDKTEKNKYKPGTRDHKAAHTAQAVISMLGISEAEAAEMFPTAFKKTEPEPTLAARVQGSEPPPAVSFTTIAEWREALQNQGLLNRFPFSRLRAAIATELEGADKQTPISLNYLGGSLLFAASVAIGTRYFIRINQGWKEPAILWLCLVGSPAYRKTFALRALLKEIYSEQNQSYQEFKARKEAGQPAHFRQYLISDATIEAISKIQEHNPHGVGLYLDELSALFAMFGRYSKGSGSMEQEALKQIFSQAPITINRKGEDPIHIPDPFLSIAGTIQPDRLGTFVNNGRDVDGFTDRVLFIVEDEYTPQELSEAQSRGGLHLPHTEAALRYILSSEGRMGVPISDQARRILLDKFNALENMKAMYEPAGAAMLGKLQTYLWRFALILEVLYNAVDQKPPNQISETNARAACDFIDYFIQMNTKARKLMSLDPFDRLSSEDQDFFSSLPDDFTTDHARQIYIKAHPDKKAASANMLVNRMLKRTDLFTKRGRGRYAKK
jgi:hypothetical protein